MSATSALICEQEGCPFVENGRCLEGLPNGEACPHLHTVDADPGSQDGSSVGHSAESGEAKEVAATPALSNEADGEPMRELGGEESLSVELADEVAAKWGARVVLFAGEHNAGKSTLIAELYAQFLQGSFELWRFAGSQCLMALDRRYHGARGPGPEAPSIPHTVDEDMRLLDLRLRDPAGAYLSLLLSDIKGEFVRQVIEGASALVELPLVVRADQTAIVIDGDSIADPFARHQAMTRARVLVGALTDPGGLQEGRPLAFLLTKKDVLDADGLTWFGERVLTLEEYARERGAVPTTILTAARPDDAPHRPKGLDDLMAWLGAPKVQPALILPAALTSPRAFLTIGAERHE